MYQVLMNPESFDIIDFVRNLHFRTMLIVDDKWEYRILLTYEVKLWQNTFSNLIEIILQWWQKAIILDPYKMNQSSNVLIPLTFDPNLIVNVAVFVYLNDYLIFYKLNQINIQVYVLFIFERFVLI